MEAAATNIVLPEANGRVTMLLPELRANSLSDFGSGRLVGGKDRIFSIRMRLD